MRGQLQSKKMEEFFYTEAVYYSGMNSSDFSTEIECMVARNKAIDKFLDHLNNDSLDIGFLDEFGDILNHYWIDPYAWFESVENHLILLL